MRDNLIEIIQGNVGVMMMIKRFKELYVGDLALLIKYCHTNNLMGSELWRFYKEGLKQDIKKLHDLVKNVRS